LLERARPEIIAHFAAATNVDRCEENPVEAAEVNVGITERLAKWAALNGAFFLFMSTDSVFDGQRGGYSETDQPRPVNRYAATKLEAEGVVQALVPEHLVVRANMYGWNAQPKKSLAEWILGLLESGQRVPGFTEIRFAPLLVNTLADTMLAMLGRNLRGLFHLASGDSLSKYEFAVVLAETFGFPRSEVIPTLAGDALKAKRPRNTSLDAGKLCRVLDLAPPTVLKDLQRFKTLREDGFATLLRAACLNRQ
jgi:dTDP-4-dehydrorhamnose reductase